MASNRIQTNKNQRFGRTFEAHTIFKLLKFVVLLKDLKLFGLLGSVAELLAGRQRLLQWIRRHFYVSQTFAYTIYLQLLSVIELRKIVPSCAQLSSRRGVEVV
jgi:hypothetical protein